MNELDLIRTNLAHLLSARSPELGARLKQRLWALQRQQETTPFDERNLGFKGFRAFLEATQSDWLEISDDSKSADILVSVRQAPVVAAAESPPPQHPTITPVRSDVWQAFTNPDLNRKRFFNIDSGEVFHFSQGEPSWHERQVREASSRFIQIEPIAAADHQRWMRGFLDSIPVTGSERLPYDAIINQPYSSALNATFTRALGDKSGAWRDYRTSRVLDVIANWADVHNIAPERIRAEVKKPEPEISVRAPAATTGGATPPSSDREKALQLLSLIDDGEISRVVLPILLATIMVKARG